MKGNCSFGSGLYNKSDVLVTQVDHLGQNVIKRRFLLSSKAMKGRKKDDAGAQTLEKGGHGWE